MESSSMMTNNNNNSTISPSSSTTSISTSKNNDFLTLHKAYIDEWLMVSFLPILKTTYDGENNFYDISNLNIKNVNQKNIPFSEQLFALDRQFQNLINQWEKLSRSDQQRAAKIESYQQSFYTFIDRIKSTLEKTMVELGGSLEDSNFLAAAISLKEKQSKNKRLTIMARSRISPGGTSSTQYQHQMHLTGPISIVWNEILIIITRRVNEEVVRLQTENINNNIKNINNSEFNITNDIYQFNNNNLTLANKLEINNQRQKLYQQALSNIVPMLFEWRIMMANAQKVISEEKRFKVNPFIPTTVYDHNSSSFISAPILISTTNKTATTLLNNLNNNINNNNNNNNNNNSNNNNNNNNSPISNSPSSSSPSPSSPTLTNRPSFINYDNQNNSNNENNINNNNNENNIGNNINNNNNENSDNKFSEEINISSSSPPGTSGMTNSTSNLPTIASPTSWTKAVKRPAMSSSGGNIPILNNLGTSLNNNNNNNKQQIQDNNNNNNLNTINANSNGNNNSSNNVNSENNNIPTGGIIKQGWMKKRGTKNKSWKKRYFILDMKKTLRYYKDNSKIPHGNNNSGGNNSSNNNNCNSGGIGSSNNNNNNNNNGLNSGSGKGDQVNGNNISLPIGNNPHFHSSSGSGIPTISPSMSSSSLENNDILSSFDNLKYKGSIDLYTSLVVAIKPSTFNVNINNSGSFKEDNNSYFGMDIITPSRTWNFCCESTKSMEDWLIVLKSANK
ncbi:hypothetical protein ACTFIW_002415 [Dictyostelium discoideum]